jgi:hypothetical protein
MVPFEGNSCIAATRSVGESAGREEYPQNLPQKYQSHQGAIYSTDSRSREIEVSETILRVDDFQGNDRALHLESVQ